VAPTEEWAAAWRFADPEESRAASDAPVASAGAVNLDANVATWTIPLQVSVTIGTPTRAGMPAGTAAAAPTGLALIEALRIPIIHDGLESRTGYQPGFLDLPGEDEIPLPELTEAGKKVAAKLEDGSTELKYHRFSVVMHKKRRLALFTAANADWRESSRKVNGRKPTRKELTGLGEFDQEQWVTDERIPEAHQLPDIFFTKDGGAFDKGHLVRRDDVCWGSSFDDIQMANGDTYHTTNCSPQVASFNQSARGEDNWGDLENLVQKQTKAEKVIIFSGPVLADDDPEFVGRDKRGETRVQIPRKFWKIVVAQGPGGPAAFGFTLEQDLAAVPTEFVVPSEWKHYMRKIADIERLLNRLVKLTGLKRIDQFDTVEARTIAEGISAPVT
jgi:endonuclease G, mitochondrial